MMTKRLDMLAVALIAAAMCGCSLVRDSQPRSRFISDASSRQGILSAQTIAMNASSPALTPDNAVVFTDNDDAFASKLRLITQARETLDLAYYIFADDYSSSVLAKALVEAAQRGVRVRLLLDYHSNYTRLDWFSMMQVRGNAGKGSLEVRLYNRPSKNIVKDAVFVTMGCGEVQTVEGQACGDAKFAEIEARFDDERIAGQAASQRNISNLNIGGSGLFLSGLYAKNPQLMALAVAEGQDIDPAGLQQGASDDATSREKLKKLGRVYFDANYGSGLERAVARVQLSAIGLVYGDEVDPLHAAFTGFVPVEREHGQADIRRDWRYLTEYLHHKFLLADGRAVQLGGRNIEDAYHMHANALTHKYVFRDTDLLVELRTRAPALSTSFERLWDFDLMVATLADVRQHAPNDYLTALRAASAACDSTQRDKQSHTHCRDAALRKAQQRSLAQRIADQRQTMLTNAKIYQQRYRRSPTSQRSPRFKVDSTAVLHYFENLPLQQAPGTLAGVRRYGADNGLEADTGKHIHALWLGALRDVCTRATAQSPQRVVLHNAYFFPPSNLWSRVARMIDGTEACSHVEIIVLTNSVETTDLNVVNIAARHSIKAFVDYAARNGDARRGATIRYYEYQAPATGDDGSKTSLHSKVLVAGPYLFIGSANADVRSYMMDTNNGFLIRNAPDLLAAYSNWVESLLADATQTRDVTDTFITTTRSAMLEQDRQTLRAILAKYRAERWIKDAQQRALIEDTMVELLNDIYRLTGESLYDDAAARDAAATFNDRYKTI